MFSRNFECVFCLFRVHLQLVFLLLLFFVCGLFEKWSAYILNSGGHTFISFILFVCLFISLHSSSYRIIYFCLVFFRFFVCVFYLKNEFETESWVCDCGGPDWFCEFEFDCCCDCWPDGGCDCDWFGFCCCCWDPVRTNKNQNISFHFKWFELIICW